MQSEMVAAQNALPPGEILYATVVAVCVPSTFCSIDTTEFAMTP